MSAVTISHLPCGGATAPAAHLDPGEIAASAARVLSEPQQAALTLCLRSDRLDFKGRLGWQQPTGSRAITNATIQSLTNSGLLNVVRQSRSRTWARLTKRGNWYARTLADQHNTFIPELLKRA